MIFLMKKIFTTVIKIIFKSNCLFGTEHRDTVGILLESGCDFCVIDAILIKGRHIGAFIGLRKIQLHLFKLEFTQISIERRKRKYRSFGQKMY